MTDNPPGFPAKEALAQESPRGDHWRCTECRAIVPEVELLVGRDPVSGYVNGYATAHLRAEHAPGCPGDESSIAYCSAHCPVAYRCGPVLLVATYECDTCEDLIEVPAPLRVPSVAGFHVYRSTTGDEVCGRLRRPDPVTEGDTAGG